MVGVGKAGTQVMVSLGALGMLVGCATVATPRYEPAQAPVPPVEAAKPMAGKVLRRKIAVARFSNETRYGRNLLTDANDDPLGKQASDMVSNRLIASGQFLVFERPDLHKVRAEQRLSGQEHLVGVDTLLVGSVTEFGRSDSGKVGFLSATKNQVARAKVEERLIDVRTGQAFVTATGTGQANTETGSIAGYGSQANYDATLNDRAIGAAVSDMMNDIVNHLQDRPWTSDVLKVDGRNIFISGGQRQGLKPGDRLKVMVQGARIRSQQTGFEITLPGRRVGGLRVEALFGDSESDEGSVCLLTDGAVPPGEAVYVAEAGEGQP